MAIDESIQRHQPTMLLKTPDNQIRAHVHVRCGSSGIEFHFPVCAQQNPQISVELATSQSNGDTNIRSTT